MKQELGRVAGMQPVAMDIERCVREALQRALSETFARIARDFGLSVHTVKRQVANILAKIGVSLRVQAATWMTAQH